MDEHTQQRAVDKIDLISQQMEVQNQILREIRDLLKPGEIDRTNPSVYEQRLNARK